jgi:hypothetical protein
VTAQTPWVGTAATPLAGLETPGEGAWVTRRLADHRLGRCRTKLEARCAGAPAAGQLNGRATRSVRVRRTGPNPYVGRGLDLGDSGCRKSPRRARRQPSVGLRRDSETPRPRVHRGWQRPATQSRRAASQTTHSAARRYRDAGIRSTADFVTAFTRKEKLTDLQADWERSSTTELLFLPGELARDADVTLANVENVTRQAVGFWEPTLALLG